MIFMQNDERDIEKFLVQEVRKKHGKAFKFVSPASAGVPDRIIILPGGVTCFVELKRPGGKPRPVQRFCLLYLYHKGHRVAVVDNKNTARALVRRLCRLKEGDYHAVHPSRLSKGRG